MNVLFLVVFIAASVLVVLGDPAAFLPALLAGASRAVALCLTLAGVYALWLGFLRVCKDAGLLSGLSRLLRPPVRRLLKTDDAAAEEQVAVNFAANLLGMGGAATPAGISAMCLFGEKKNEYARAMLFVVNCAGVQLLPTTLISVRAAAGSAQPFAPVLPALCCSLAALLFGAILVHLLYRKRRCA